MPEGSKRVRSKWVSMTKSYWNGNNGWYKARVIAKRFTQKDTGDYKTTFSLVSKERFIKNYHGIGGSLWSRVTTNGCENILPKRRIRRGFMWINLEVFCIRKRSHGVNLRSRFMDLNKLLDAGILSLMIPLHLSDLRKCCLSLHIPEDKW